MINKVSRNDMREKDMNVLEQKLLVLKKFQEFVYTVLIQISMHKLLMMKRVLL